jgi:hypothetical protein
MLLGFVTVSAAACASSPQPPPSPSTDPPAHVRIRSEQRVRVLNADTMFRLLPNEVYEVEPGREAQPYPDYWRIRIVETHGFVLRAAVAPTHGGSINPTAGLLEAVREARRRASNRVWCEMQSSRDLETMEALREIYTSEYVLSAFRANGESTIRYSDVKDRTRPDLERRGLNPNLGCEKDETVYPDVGT